ncbi:MAG: FeoB-associated Cys-rich membrane protein [Lachnospiraceae bacterium]|nr:FeoB-associated Cys-rich membrane protein [Lachnospiraceae bacterium]
MGTVITGLILAGIIALIVRNMVRDKKNGKSLQCGCNCKHCSGHCEK